MAFYKYSVTKVSTHLFLKVIFSALVLYFSTFSSQGQNFIVEDFTPEKIYLQLHSKIYYVNEPIWFKAIVTNNQHIQKSKVLHVSLINAQEERVIQQKIKLTNGIGEGALKPTEHLKEGRYLLRAYTRWNRNFQEEFLFQEYIYLSNGQNKIPKDTSWINLVVNSIDSGYSKKFTIQERTPDLQFFPESGRLLHGFKNKLGLTAIGPNGSGTSVKGSIYDEGGTAITSFECNPMGMGLVEIKVDSTKSYYAKIESDSKSIKSKKYILPKVFGDGHILSISNFNDKILIKVASTKKEEYVYIKVASGGRDYFLIEGGLKNGYLTKALESNKLPPGILKFTLMGADKVILGERLFFNNNENHFKIKVEPDKDEYTLREKTKLKIRLNDKKLDPGKINLSVSVIKKEQYLLQNETIRSFFLLSSEIQGEIEKPDFYFENDSLKLQDLDALLLTQGWRNYKYDKIKKLEKLFLPEKGLEVIGRVSYPSHFKKPAKNVKINLSTFGQKTTFYSGTTDSLGRFRFLLNDEYDNVPIFLNAQNSFKSKVDYQIEREKNTSPSFNFNKNPSSYKLEQLHIAEKKLIKNSLVKPHGFSTENINELDEVLITGNAATKKELERYNKYGKPDRIIDGEEIRAKEKKWSYGLYSVLLFNYGEDLEIEKFPDGFMLAHIRAGGEPTLLLVDGQLLKKYQYELVPDMDPGVVKNVELIKYAKFFKSRYLEVFPSADPLKAPSIGHIISITTEGGGGVYQQGEPAIGSLRDNIKGFSQSLEFYIPKYEQLSKHKERKTDFRSLVHWVPILEPNQNGVANLQFYNNDVPGDYIIIVEGMDDQGKIGYAKRIYQVKE